MRPKWRLLVTLTGTSLAVVAGGWVGKAVRKSPMPVYVNPVSMGVQREVVAVLLVSSTCGASTDPTFPETLDRLRQMLHEAARASGARPVFSAIATDWDPREGIRVLERFGHFDEISAGRQWLGPGAQFSSADPRFTMAVPQIVFLERVMVVAPGRTEIRDQRILKRVVGLGSLAALANSGSLANIFVQEAEEVAPSL